MEFAGGGLLVLHRYRDPDKAHWLFGGAAVGAGDAGDRNRAVGVRSCRCAFGHGDCDWLGNGTVGQNQAGVHAQQVGLGLIGIDNET